jgi:hypothetical protein
VAPDHNDHNPHRGSASADPNADADEESSPASGRRVAKRRFFNGLVGVVGVVHEQRRGRRVVEQADDVVVGVLEVVDQRLIAGRTRIAVGGDQPATPDCLRYSRSRIDG